ncbi:MAG: uroporphyrinogen-III synthase [Gammaproteobacteria bacterium]|nr:uroporphyrinogen-III synthase [Gammaproteobacteria bacterium]
MSHQPSGSSVTCLVTRPAHQTELLNRLLTEAGFYPLNFPTIAIAAASPTPFLTGLPDNIRDYDLVLFVSRNAVDFSFHFLDPEQVPADLQFGVIGKGSWMALKDHGIESQIIPASSYNSEGLLQSPALQKVAGKRVLIMRGQEGRNLLGDTLRERGAEVDYCEVYRRELPATTAEDFALLTAEHIPEIVVFTSAEGLHNCFKLLNQPQADQLRGLPWLLISDRMRETARDLGHNAEVIIAGTASDEGIVLALQHWRQSKT